LHGKDSRPWGTKIRVFAEVAEAMGCKVHSPDFRGMDDPKQRIQYLLNVVAPNKGKLVLVGSSMGAYVSIAASAELKPDGLFVVAPAVYLPLLECDDVTPVSPFIEVVHGWQDEVVPAENAVRFAREHHATLHMFDGDHRLLAHLPAIKELFKSFLQRVLEEA
jgi:alpha/beta superfamily hydrolase